MLTSFEKLLGFLLYLFTPLSDRDEWSSSLETEDAQIPRTCWTPDCFVSRKVRLLKIIKTDSVINITRACTEIFPKADTKTTTHLTTKDRYNSARCVIIKDKAWCLQILRETSFEFVLLRWSLQYKTRLRHRAVQNVSCHFCTLQDCIHSGQIGTGNFDHRRISKFVQLQNSRV